MKRFLTILAALSIAVTAFAAGGVDGAVEKQSLNVNAIVMFLIFVAATLGITYWAAKKNKNRKRFLCGWRWY